MTGLPLYYTSGIAGANEDSLVLTDVTTGNTSTSKHGLAPSFYA